MVQIKKYNPVDHKIKAVVYGPSGSGKTTFGGTAPKPIFASAEAGLLSIADKSPDFAEIRSLKDLNDLHNYLKTKDHNYETVIIDSISEVNEIIKLEIEKRTGRAIEKALWSEVQKKIRGILRCFRDLPMHVLFIAQEKAERDDNIITRITPMLNGKSATDIAYFMDIVGYLYINKAGEREMITNEHSKLPTKSRGGFITNSLNINFQEWVNTLKRIKTGEQKVVAENVKISTKVSNKNTTNLPQLKKKEVKPKEELKPKKETKIKEEVKPKKKVEKKEEVLKATTTDKKQIFALWDEFFKLAGLKMNNEGDFAPKMKDPQRKATMKKYYSVNSTKDITHKDAVDFIDKLNRKIKMIKPQVIEEF